VQCEGRFVLGVGSGENLNEHILGDRWPPSDVRQEMLEEAVEVIRQLWEGGSQSFYGEYYTVENARIYTLPERPPEILVAAGGTRAGELAGRIGDGLIATSADKEVVQAFEQAGGDGKTRIGQFACCWAPDEAAARKTAHEWWPTAATKGELNQELPLPAHFEQATALAREEDVAKAIVCGPDPQRHLAKVKEFADAGFTHVYVHQVGPDQEGFFRIYEREVLPRLK
jgi:G6PDH family F420-dependent oxidoreductase